MHALARPLHATRNCNAYICIAAIPHDATPPLLQPCSALHSLLHHRMRGRARLCHARATAFLRITRRACAVGKAAHAFRMQQQRSTSAALAQSRVHVLVCRRQRPVNATCAVLLLLLLLKCCCCFRHNAAEDRHSDSAAAAAPPSGLDATAFLNNLARDSFFHYVDPSFSPFICSRSPHVMYHPIVLRFTTEAVTKLRLLRAAVVRVDVGLYLAADADTDACAALPAAPSVDDGWCICPCPRLKPLFGSAFVLA